LRFEQNSEKEKRQRQSWPYNKGAVLFVKLFWTVNGRIYFLILFKQATIPKRRNPSKKKEKTLSDNAQEFLGLLKQSADMGRASARSPVRSLASNQVSA
jgi:hypothetical protein